MDIINRYRKTAFTVLAVESIPCSLVGNKIIFSDADEVELVTWELPWPMPWIKKELHKLSKEVAHVSSVKTLKIYNPEEADQYVEVRVERYIDLTVGQLLDKVADVQQDHIAIINHKGDTRYSYKQLREMSDSLAKGLISLGVKKDEKVAIWSTNSIELIVSQFGISSAGAVATPLSPYERKKSMIAFLKQSDATTLIMKAGVKNGENIEMLYEICPELKTSMEGELSCKTLPSLKNVIILDEAKFHGTYRWMDVLALGTHVEDEILEDRKHQQNYNDSVHMIYTSGTTGMPKGVLLSHGNVIENAFAMAKKMELTPDDIMCVQAPFFHCFGCVACTITAIASGSSMVVIERFRSNLTLNVIEQERCTVASGVPTMFLGFVEEMKNKKYDVSSLRTGIIAGATCPPELINEITETLGMKEIIIAYGLTETSPCVTATNINDSVNIKGTTVGSTIPGVEIKIIDINTKLPAKQGEKGEIYVKGYNVMKGYYNMPEETASAIDDDGWFRTGDIGILREDGYLELICRLKDVIIRGGENISPKEIELHIGTHPDVEEVYIVGVPDEFFGEEIAAFIRLREGSNLSKHQVQQYCKGELASNKVPKYVRFVEQFPLSGTGKVLKGTLRSMILDMAENQSRISV